VAARSIPALPAGALGPSNGTARRRRGGDAAQALLYGKLVLEEKPRVARSPIPLAGGKRCCLSMPGRLAWRGFADTEEIDDFLARVQFRVGPTARSRALGPSDVEGRAGVAFAAGLKSFPGTDRRGEFQAGCCARLQQRLPAGSIRTINEGGPYKFATSFRPVVFKIHYESNKSPLDWHRVLQDFFRPEGDARVFAKGKVCHLWCICSRRISGLCR